MSPGQENMMRLTTLIVDDDGQSRTLLQSMIEKLFGGLLHVIGSASNVSEALSFTEQHKPDLIFLDIEMPDGTGFDFLEKTGFRDFKLIITSGHESYAVRAFRYNADDYLLKPFSIDELKAAINKAIEAPIYSRAAPEFRMLIDYINGNRSRISLPATGGLEFVNISEIIRCEASGNYTKVFLKSGHVHLVAKTLKVYEDLLTPDGFVRIHAAHLVNIKEVKSFIRGERGQILMTDGTLLEISRSRKDEFLAKVRG